MKKKDEWISEIETAIDRLKNNGRKVHYIISAEMSNQTANVLLKYFEEDYEIEIKKCMQCKNSFDIVITWELE